MTYRKRSRIIAIGATLVIPGGGHFYTGETKRAFAVLAAYVLSFVVTFAGALAESQVVALGALLAVTTLVFDLVGAQRVISRRPQNR